MILQRKLRAMYCGKEDYRPAEMPLNKYIPVIGYTTHKRKINKNGKEEFIDQPFLICIGSNGVAIEIVMFNLKIMIDDRDYDLMNNLTQMLRNITIIGKNLSEKFKINTTEKSPDNV